MKKLMMISAMALAGVSQAQAPQVGQYELLTGPTWLSLWDSNFSLGAQLGYQLQPELYLAASFAYVNNEWGSSFRVAPLVEYVLPQSIGVMGAMQINNDGLHWLRGRVFYRQFGEPYRLDYFAEYMHSENWADVNVGVASKYYLADNFSLNADGYLQWAFDNSDDSPYVRPIIGTGFSFFF